jgi:hypothetical protein
MQVMYKVVLVMYIPEGDVVIRFTFFPNTHPLHPHPEKKETRLKILPVLTRAASIILVYCIGSNMG